MGKKSVQYPVRILFDDEILTGIMATGCAQKTKQKTNKQEWW